MRDHPLDQTANLILHHDGMIDPHLQFQFLDAAGQEAFVLFCRERQLRGQKGIELVLNGRNAAGHWGSELVTAVPAAALSAGLELRLRSWQAEVRVGGQSLLNCNPGAVFGPAADPAHLPVLRTNAAVETLRLETGARVAHASTGQRGDVTLVLLDASGRPAAARRAEFAGLAYGLRRVVVVDTSAGGAAAETAVNAALAAVGTDVVAVLSGHWRAEDFERSLLQYAEGQGAGRLMLLASSLRLAPGELWGAILPARTSAGRAGLRLAGGLAVIDPELTSAGSWTVSRVWQAEGALPALRRAAAFQPLDTDAAGRVLRPLRRMGPESHVILPGATGAAPAFAGQRLDSRTLPANPAPRSLLAPLAQAARDGAAEQFQIWAPDTGNPARAAAWAELALLDPVALVVDGAGQPVGLWCGRDFLAPETFAAFEEDDHGLFNTPCADLATALTALADLAGRLGYLVARTPLAALDARPAPAAPAGARVWLSPAATVYQRLTAALPPLDPARPAPPPAMADVEALVLQGFAHGMVWQTCQHAIALDLRWPEAGFVTRLIEVFDRSGYGEHETLGAAFLEALIARNYHDELAPLQGLVRRTLARPLLLPTLRLRFRTIDLNLRLRDPLDRLYCDPAALPLAELEPGPGLEGLIAGVLDALSFYLALRRDWQAILDWCDRIDLPADMSQGFHERHAMAQILCGAPEGLGPRIAALNRQGRLSDWTAHRLALRLAALSDDLLAREEALVRLLQGEADMAALLAPPTRFRQITAADPDAPEALPDPVVLAPDAIVAIIVARNEFTRLRWLVDYYRHLGVDHVFLIDNMSDDETIAHFARQPDVTLLQTDENYRDSRYGVKWHNEVAAAWAEDRWVLTVDSDEALVFDGCGHAGALRDLCDRLQAEGAEGFYAPMIDMYSADRLDRTDYRPGQSLIETFPMFDGAGYRFDPTPGCPVLTMSGGVRIRLFWGNRHDTEVPHLAMQKVPLVRWKAGFCYLASTHDMVPIRVSEETGALLHFKFMPDFHRRAMEEVRRNQHYEGAREYRIYAEFLRDPKNRSFVYPGSLRYEGPESLAAAGLIQTGDPARLTTTASAAWTPPARDALPEDWPLRRLDPATARDAAARKPAPKPRTKPEAKPARPRR